LHAPILSRHFSAARKEGSAQTTILSIDLKGALRRRKPAKRTSQLAPRPREALVDIGALSSLPLFLLLDTNVYINRAAGRLDAAVRDAVDQALLFHCSVTLAELAVGVANADPMRPGWSALQGHYAELFASIPASRLLTPDAQVWTDAGVIAGTLARTQGFQPHQRKECLNDALIFLTAAKAGLPVLTANRVEFDLIQQLAPEGQFIHC
jgi:predicted nucleic acid-binding protein